MRTLNLFLYAAIFAAVAYVVYRVVKLGEGLGAALAAAGQKIKDIAGGAVNDVASAHSNAVDALSNSFHSDAEDQVNNEYGPAQGWKVNRGRQTGVTRKEIGLPTTANGDKTILSFLNPDVYAAGISPLLTKNPPAGVDFGTAGMRKCDALGNCGNYPRASAPVGGTLSTDSNMSPQNNDTVFDKMTFPY